MISTQRTREIAAVQERYDTWLMRFPNVVGTGIGYRQRKGQPTDELCLVVMVSQKLERSDLPDDAILPSELDGVLVDVVETGAFVV
ncbi:MAG: hypothetical protein OXG53_14185 [Chloroflexi bacterium]|nr:hypothetical protein [Chloroflexota bacterium]